MRTFKFNGSYQQVFGLLEMAYEVELSIRKVKIQIDNETTDNLRQVAQWLIDDKKKCGLYLCGVCGSGKSTMMKAIRNLITLSKNNYWEGLSREVSYMSYTASEINMMYTKGSSLANIMNADLLFIDDLGTESVEVVEYGNVFKPVEHVLSHRYDKQLHTIISTNLKPSEIKERYGTRLADRFREMFLKVTFKQTKSYR